MERYRMLRATKHNWGLVCPGDWTTVTWRIYSDGSYNIRNAFHSAWDERPGVEDFFCTPKKKYKSMSGKMDVESFSELRVVLDTKQWRDPNLEIDACDGVAWEFKYYDSGGKLLNDSGKIGYIYGEACLQRIVSLLPKTDEIYDANAFVSVNR